MVGLTILFSIVTGYGWDNAGHSLTAAIAWEHMTPIARQRVFKLIMNAPEDSDLSVAYNAYNSRSEKIKKLELFMLAANWSDTIKDRSFKIRNEKYNHSNWHYGDIFWEQNEGKAKILPKFSGEGGFAVSKLFDFEATMRDPNSSDPDKAIAIAWFMHVAGDLHNPLHNASRVTKLDPDGDQGGNRFILRKSVGSIRGYNLHSYWDSLITQVKKRKKDECDTTYIPKIAKSLTRKYPRKRFKNLYLSDYKRWNLEGFELLNSQVYTKNLVRNKMPSRKYKKSSYRTASKGITLAGYRIAETLNAIFGQPEKNSSSDNV